MNKIKVKVQKLHPDAFLPVFGSEYAAGADLKSIETRTLQPGETALIHTGLSLEIPEGYGGFLFARSGLATKRGLAPANKVGVIDADYRGELLMSMLNHSGIPQTIEKGERIAQLVLLPFLAAEYIEAESLSDTARGGNGFGSTGRK